MHRYFLLILFLSLVFFSIGKAGLALAASQGEVVTAGSPGACKCQLNTVEGSSMCANAVDRPPVYEPTPEACRLYCTASTAAPNEACVLAYDPVPTTQNSTTVTMYCCREDATTGTLTLLSGPQTLEPNSNAYDTARNQCQGAGTNGTFTATACTTGQQTDAARTDASVRERAATGAATTAAGRVTLPNPLGTTNPQVLIGRAIKAVLSIVGSLALLMFIYGGILWLTAAGSSEGVKKGKEIIKWSVAGLVLIFSAYIILGYILNALRDVVK